MEGGKNIGTARRGCATLGSAKPVRVLVVRASVVAGLLAPRPEGSEESRVFGKVFEEEFTFATHMKDRAGDSGRKNVGRIFLSRMEEHMREEGIFDPRLLARARDMYIALTSAGVTGSKPRTLFRMVSDGMYVAAQPDLETFDSAAQKERYIEFKTYPIDAFGRAQALVFSWVLEAPVLLVGLKETEGGFASQSEEIVADSFTPPEIPKDICERQEFCIKHSCPVNRCP